MLRRTKPLTRKKPLGASRARVPGSDADRRLWSILETREVAGLSFRHCERIGPYTADFVCPAARLVLLLNDDQARDDGRAAWFRLNGYRVLEFPSSEVSSNPDGVLDVIARSFELRIVPRKS